MWKLQIVKMDIHSGRESSATAALLHFKVLHTRLIHTTSDSLCGLNVIYFPLLLKNLFMADKLKCPHSFWQEVKKILSFILKCSDVLLQQCLP